VEQLDFLDLVWGKAEGFVQFAQKRMDEQGHRTGDPTDTKEYRWPQERDRIGRWFTVNDRLEDTLYFAVPLYSAPQRQQVNLKAISAIYVDNDGVDGSQTGGYALPPSVSVFSSPGHQHDYWVLSEPADPNRSLRLGKIISALHQHDNIAHGDMKPEHKFCGTDPGGWDSTQLLRVPGSINNKPEYGPGFQHRVAWEDSGARYTIEQLEAAFKVPENFEYVNTFSMEELPSDLPKIEDLLANLGHRQDIIALFSETPSGRGDSSGWDERLFALENELFRMGHGAREVFVIARSSACNKYARGIRNADGTFSPRRNPDLDLWKDVYKAEQTHVMRGSTHTAVDYNPSGSTFAVNGTPAPADESAPVLTRPPAFSMQVLTDEEIGISYSHRTWIDTYIDWATSKTDAAVVYHIASAFTILSLVFGEFGHVGAKFGKIRLNLWFLVMGKTTRARKSTSRNLLLKVLEGLQSSKYQYDEGSNFTAEGLETALLEKNKRSSLIHRDEVQGLFKEINGKNYMAGLNDKLTELYDGRVGGKKRATGGENKSSESAETNFVIFMMGIVSKITEILTLEDFQSGFLARFIHVIGEAPARTEESEWLDQAPINEIAQGDPLYVKMVKELMEKRNEWSKKVPDFETRAIRFEDDAWRRWNKANWEMQKAIQLHERAEILEAALDRMSKSALKAAALIAMADGREKVNMNDVLVSLRYAQDWAIDMVRSSELVSESFWKKDLNHLRDLIIAKGGHVKWEEAYSKMDKRPNEFAQLVEGFVQSGMGRSTIDPVSKGRWIEAFL